MAEEFTCNGNMTFRSACADLPEYKSTGYCVLHFPGEGKKDDFREVLESKLAQKDYNFSGTVFPESTSDFKRREFDADTRFDGAIFIGDANFTRAHFCGETTDFRRAHFCGKQAYFSDAHFSGAVSYFSEAQFGGKLTSFSRAEFSKLIDFTRAYFRGVQTLFSEAHFSGENTYFSDAQFCGERIIFTDVQFCGEQTSFSRAQFDGKLADFQKAHFRGEQTSFTGAHFSGERTIFSKAQFDAETTSFERAEFSVQPNFQDTTLRNATFKSATFARGADFTRAAFDGTRAISNGIRERTTDFRRATFDGELYFRGAKFKGFTDFNRTNFLDAVKFIGGERDEEPSPVFAPEGQVNFKRARIDKPDLFSFDTLRLRPSWFVGVDARKFDFTAVDWGGLLDGSANTLDREIKGIREKGETGSPYVLLAQACRRLSANAEENREYPLANEFQYWSMDALRTEGRDYRKETWDSLVWIRRTWLRVAKRCGPATTLRLVWSRIRSRHQGRPRKFGYIPTLYWALNGYGVRTARAFWVLMGIWATSTILYMIVDPSEFKDFGQGIGYLWQAAVYSLLALARLNPEPRPEEPGVFQFFVGLEGILGPLQIALLALAVRRKVMR